MSHVMCDVSRVAHHLSLSPPTNANSHRQRPSPCFVPQLCTVGWFAKNRNLKNLNAKILWSGQMAKIMRVMPILAICSLTRSFQATGKRDSQTWRDIRTLQLIDLIGLGADLVKLWHNWIPKRVVNFLMKLWQRPYVTTLLVPSPYSASIALLLHPINKPPFYSRHQFYAAYLYTSNPEYTPIKCFDTG